MMTNSNTFWVDFFENNEESDDIADELRSVGIKSNFLRPDWNISLTPWVFPDHIIKEKKQSLNELFALIQRLPQVLFNNDLLKFAQAIGYSEQSILELINRFSQSKGLLSCRWDILCGASGWKVLEVNVGGANGGFAYDSVQQIYDRILSQQDDCTIKEIWQSPYEHIASYIRDKLSKLNNAKVLVVDDDEQFRQQPQLAQCAANVLSARLNLDVTVTSELEQISSEHDGNIIVFEVFTLRDIAHSGVESYQAYLDGLANAKICPVINLLGDLYMSKAILPILNPAVRDDALSTADKAIVDDFIVDCYLVNLNSG